MRLVSLTLENIKSYINETIVFYDGVNFVSGANGAGKTTIIEAIGYALFDASPFSAQRQFIREGQKSATITVVLEAQDERIYRIVRRLRMPSGGSWAVYDEESGMELNELHGNIDVKAWLAANLNMTGGLDPVKLFEDVIGISQGKFTAPFLERAKERKDTFNKILQLDSYREAFEKTSGLDALFGKSIGEKEGEKKSLLVRVEDWEICKSELAVNCERMTVFVREIKAVTEELRQLEQQIDEQEKLKTLIDSKEKELQNLAVHLEGLRVKQERIAKDQKEAALCQEKVNTATPGYLAYGKLQEEQKAIEMRRKLQDALILEQQRYETAIASTKAQLKSETQNRVRQLADGEIELKELTLEGERTAAERAGADIKKSDIEKNKLLLAGQQDFWNFPNQAVSRCKQAEAVIAAQIENYRQLLNEKEKLGRLLSRETELELIARCVPALEFEQKRASEELSRLNGKLASLDENSKATHKGMCPFLETPCLNIEGSLDQYFTKEIEKLMPGILELRRRNEELEARLAQGRKAAEECKLLLNYKEQLGQVMLQARKTEQAFDREYDELQVVLQPEKLKYLEDSYRKMVGSLAGVQDGYKDELIGAEEALTQAINGCKQQFNKAFPRTGLLPGTGNYLEQMTGLVNNLNSLVAQLELIKELAGAIWKNADNSINRLLQETGGSLAALDNKLNTLRERYRKVSSILQVIRDDHSLEELEQKLREKELELAGTVEKLLQYCNLEEEWEKNKEMSAAFEPEYILYMQNIETAGKLSTLRHEAQQIQEEESLLAAEAQRQKSVLQQLKIQFAEEILSSIRERREKLVGERAKKEADFEYASREAEKYERLLNEKKLLFREIEVLDTQIEKEREAQAMLQLIRTTLNQSGEKMAQVYRQFIGREADLIYQQVAAENVHLLWAQDYEIKIVDHPDNNLRERIFGQLSGGEKMTAALAIRLALLKQLSGLGIGFFDEPTANLDEKRRSNLARIIPEITRNFNQVFVVSHDDAFDAITENIIALKKDTDKGTIVVNA